MRKDLLSIADLERDEIENLIRLAATVKEGQRKGARRETLAGKSLGLLFEKPSLRTRVTFEVGMIQLGGYAVVLDPQMVQIGKRETVIDAARNLERWLDALCVRTFSHALILDLAVSASVPVINGLTDLYHPCQVLADVFTLKEKRKEIRNLVIAYVGDGNNVANSWLWAAARLDLELRVATPEAYRPDRHTIEETRGGRITLLNDPVEAVSRADVVYTDVWTSMGKESETEARRKTFQPYQVNRALLSHASREALVMHCLPAHRGEEITDEILDGPQSIVYDQAENRLHLQKAVLEALIGGRENGWPRM